MVLSRQSKVRRLNAVVALAVSFAGRIFRFPPLTLSERGTVKLRRLHERLPAGQLIWFWTGSKMKSARLKVPSSAFATRSLWLRYPGEGHQIGHCELSNRGRRKNRCEPAGDVQIG